MIAGLEAGDLDQVVANMGNVLEQVTAVEYPVIGEIKEQMLAGGAMGAMMTGSGPTVFGLFQDQEQAEQVRAKLRQDDRIRQVYLTNWFTPRK